MTREPEPVQLSHTSASGNHNFSSRCDEKRKSTLAQEREEGGGTGRAWWENDVNTEEEEEDTQPRVSGDHGTHETRDPNAKHPVGVRSEC